MIMNLVGVVVPVLAEDLDVLYQDLYRFNQTLDQVFQIISALPKVDVCSDQMSNVKLLIEDFKKNPDAWDNEKIQQTIKIISSYSNACQSSQEVQDFSTTLQAKISGVSVQQEYDQLGEKLRTAAAVYKKEPLSFSEDQIKEYLRMIVRYNVLEKKEGTKKNKDYEREIKAFNLYLQLASKSSGKKESSQEIAELKKRIEEIQELYGKDPAQYIKAETAKVVAAKDAEQKAVIARLSKKGDNVTATEGQIEVMENENVVELAALKFNVENDGLFQILAELKRYKELDSPGFDAAKNAFAQELLSEIYKQIAKQAQAASNSYHDIFTSITPIAQRLLRNGLYEKLFDASLRRVERYRDYSRLFGYSEAASVDDLEKKLKDDYLKTLKQMIIDGAGNARKSSLIAHTILLNIEKYEELSKKLGQAPDNAVIAIRNQLLADKPRHDIDTLVNTIITQLQPYSIEKTHDYNFDKIDNVEATNALALLIDFQNKVNEYNKSKSESEQYDTSVKRDFLILQKQINLTLNYRDIVQLMKEYRKNKNGENRSRLLQKIEKYNTELQSFRNLTFKEDYNTAIVKQLEEFKRELEK